LGGKKEGDAGVKADGNERSVIKKMGVSAMPQRRNSRVTEDMYGSGETRWGGGRAKERKKSPWGRVLLPEKDSTQR